MFNYLRKAAVLVPLLSLGATPMSAQVFTTPTANEYIFGSTYDVIKPQVTANYSRGLFPSGFGTTDIYLAGWSSNDPTGRAEFIYTFTNPFNPMAIVSQGSFIYGSVADLEVGIVATSFGHYILAAYYDYTGSNSPSGNPGHVLDVYKLTGSPASPLALSSKVELSQSPTYGRLRMDSHKDYAVAIAWEYPGIGIQTMVGNMGSWSGVTTLNGTFGEQGPDVAFSHSSGPLNVHFVYQNPWAGTITESVMDWSVLLSIPYLSTATIPPVIEDVTGAASPMSNVVIDCPDHYDVENWAYTYTDGDRVYVRHMDYHSAASPITTIVNNGSLGNIPLIKKYTAHTPTLHYGDGAVSWGGGTTGQISVGWSSTYSFSGTAPSHYIGIEMKEGGGALLSAPDYMRLPNSYLPYSYNNSGIAYSKQSDGAATLAPDYMYATYFTENPAGSGLYELHHAFHKWNNPVFRGGTPPTAGHGVECHSPTQNAIVDVLKTDVSPNPFQNKLTNNIVLKEEATVHLTLVNVTGQVVAQKDSKLSKGNHAIEMNGLDKLAAGNYILTTTVNGKISGSQVMIKQ